MTCQFLLAATIGALIATAIIAVNEITARVEDRAAFLAKRCPHCGLAVYPIRREEFMQ